MSIASEFFFFQTPALNLQFLNHQQKKWQKAKAQHFHQLSGLWGTCWDASQNLPTSEDKRNLDEAKPPLMHLEISLEKFPGSQFCTPFWSSQKRKKEVYKL